MSVFRYRVWRPLTAASVGLSLIGNLAGCAPEKPPIPPPISEDLRHRLGVVGVASVTGPTAGELDVPVRGAGAARGAGAGAATGAAGGAQLLAGSGTASGMAAGGGAAVALGALVVLIPLGIVVGALVGAATAVPEDTARGIEATLAKVLKETPIQQRLHQEVVALARQETEESIVDLDALGLVGAGGIADYGALGARGIDTLLEVRASKAGLVGGRGGDPELSLFVEFSIRLIDTASGETLFENQSITHRTAAWRFTEWGAEDAALLRQQLTASFRGVANRIVDTVFLEVRWD
jgi:hypothetical protein